ncbi:MAG: hypothetical protein KBE09_05015 [Candidatus Pacebacteria bacterium]|nr:hypothetical protein [Candidatus Paceibacterota bacterium]
MAIVLVTFVAWSLFSWVWYVCGIKNLCEASTGSEVAHVLVPLFSAETADAAAPTCLPYLTEDILAGKRNNPAQVRRLEHFLSTMFGEPLASDGMYGRNDIAAVKRYEARRFGGVVTGSVNQATRDSINADVCESTVPLDQ